MLEPIPLAEYRQVLASKLRGGMQIHRHYGTCMHMLVSRWAARLPSHQTLILMFILDRTFYHDKLSETVVFDQFLHGMTRKDRDEVVFSGLKISLPTLLKSLKELSEADLIHVRACFDEEGKGEIKPRLYAINCKKLFNLDIADEKNPMILREPKAKKVAIPDETDADDAPRAARNLLKTPRKVVGNVRLDPPQKVEGIYTNNRITKVIHVGGPADAETGSKVNVSEVMENYRATREAKRVATTTKKPARASSNNPFSRVNMQTLVDECMDKYHHGLPRLLLNDKALGVLRKRMTEAGTDRDLFIDWALRFWQTTADAHGRAARRRVADTVTMSYQAIPRAPDFNILAYRFPYFLACFRSYLQAEKSGLATSREELLERKVAKLERSVQSAKDEVRSAQVRERSLRQRPTTSAPALPERPARIVRRAPTNLDHLLNEDLPPAWDEVDTKKANR